jgi:hypothetical protein
MIGTARRSISAIASLCLAVIAASSLPTAAEELDTSRLPRVAGAKESFASAATTIYISPDPVAQTAEATSKALAALGWQAYLAPFTARAQNPNMAIMSLKKGPQALNVFITVAPAQGNATSVSYTAVALATDLPFPRDAADIEFDPNRPSLNCVTSDAIDRTLEFYRRELGALGWSLWSAKLGGKLPDGGLAGEMTERGAFAYYIRDNQKPLLLVLQRRDDARTAVELKSVSAQVLADARQAEVNRSKPPLVPPAAPAPAAAPAKPARTASDDMADDIMKQVQQIARQATADALAGAKAPAAPASKASNEPLRASTGSDAPIPVPESAEAVAFDGAQGELKFSSPASVSALSAFFRAAMKPLGWQERKSVINRENMVVLDFSKNGKKLSLTIMQMGNMANVTADGSGLIVVASKDTAPAASVAIAAPPSADDLEAEESGGLPVPKRHTLAEGTRTPFRQELKASVPLDLAAVLGFYRRELSKRSWKEQTDGAVVAPDHAVVVFATPEGAAVLKLGRKDSDTSVSLAVKNPDAAKQAGIIPKPGQVKVLFGNMLGTEAIVTINNKTIKVGAGVGAKRPDGPTLDVPPGKYKYSLKVPGKPTQSEELEVGADEARGLLIGPGGALPMNVY